MALIHGLCEPAFKPVGDAFAANFDAGLELGASLAVTHHGRTVVDLWGGYADRKRTRPWQEHTIANVFSTSKVPTSLCVYLLIDRGQIDINLPIRTYWPEFTGGGKDVITMRHVLLHSAGLPGLRQPQSFQTTLDWDVMVHLLENEDVWFEPGSMQAYHAITYSWLVGEVVRRITGKSLGTFFRYEVAEPLAIDFHIGLPRSEQARVAQLDYRIPPEDEMPPQTDMRMRAAASFEPGNWASPEGTAAEVPASNGNGNARSVARIASILAMGGTLDGVTLLSRETVAECTREHSRERDECMDNVVARCLGLGLSSEFFEMFTPNSIGWGGAGGSVCMFDPQLELVIAYVPNGLEMTGPGSDPRTDRVLGALSDMVDTLDA